MIPWTVARQAPLYMRFPRQEYQSGSHFLLQEIFLTHRLNLCLLHCRWILYHWATWEARIRLLQSVSSVAQSCLTLWPHGLQHARLPCPLLTPRVCSNSWQPAHLTSGTLFAQWSHPSCSTFHILCIYVHVMLQLSRHKISMFYMFL